MAIRFELRDDNVRAVRFMVSPLVEAALSLNAYLFPQTRGLQHEWIRSMRRLPVALRREIQAFGFVLDFAIPDCLLPTHGRSPASFAEELERLAGLEPRIAGYEILRPSFHYEIASASGARGARSRGCPRARPRASRRATARARVALARLSFSRPEELQARFVALLDDYWRLGFGEAWARLEPRLLAVARRDARSVAGSGVYSILDGRFADTVVDRRNGVLMRRSPHEHTVRPTRRRPLVLDPERLRLAARSRQLRRPVAARPHLPAGRDRDRDARFARSRRRPRRTARARRPCQIADPTGDRDQGPLDRGARRPDRPEPGRGLEAPPHPRGRRTRDPATRGVLRHLCRRPTWPAGPIGPARFVRLPGERNQASGLSAPCTSVAPCVGAAGTPGSCAPESSRNGG